MKCASSQMSFSLIFLMSYFDCINVVVVHNCHECVHLSHSIFVYICVIAFEVEIVNESE